MSPHTPRAAGAVIGTRRPWHPQSRSLAHPSQPRHGAGKPISSAQKLIRIPQNTPKFCPISATQSLACPHHSASPKHLDLATPPHPQAAVLRLGRGRNQGASPQPPKCLLAARCRARAGSRWPLSARRLGTARGSWAWKGTAQLLRLRCPAPARAPRPHSHLPGGFGLPQGHMPAVPGLSHVTQAGDTHTC